MDIEHFYDANPARRTSREYSFGQDWTDEGGTRWELNWVEDTGELYLIREAVEPMIQDAVGDSFVPSMDADEVTVEIIGVLIDLRTVESALASWSERMPIPSSADWVRRRVADAERGEPNAASAGADPDPTTLDGAH